MAEGVFQAMSKQPPYQGHIGLIDSCGTIGYHTGDEPDERTLATLSAHGITDYRHRARKITTTDFDRFDYIFAMDRQNLDDLLRLQRKKPDSKARVMLFGEYAQPRTAADGEIGTVGRQRAEVISDPYYGGQDGFSKAYEQTTRFSRNFLASLCPGEAQGSHPEEASR